MAGIQKVTDSDLTNFLKQNLTKLDTQQKVLLFQKLEIPINYAISKAINKFHFLPLERNDFLSIAWMAFEEVLHKYQAKPTRKTFITFLIDSVYWKSMDYALSFITNHHKVLNQSDRKFCWVETESSLACEDLGKKITRKMIVEDYFQSLPNGQISLFIFTDYVNQTPLFEICKKYQISRHIVKRILSKTIDDLSKLLA